jgi:ABC-type protease/lipase transport system fused ATPase/permease subunit
LTEASLRHREQIYAMGMGGNLLARWQRDRMRMQQAEARSICITGGMEGLSRFLRLSMQSLILGLSAWLVIRNQLSSAAILPASIMLGRALQPISQIVGVWRGVFRARSAYASIEAVLSEPVRTSAGITLPAPQGALQVEGLSYAAPGARGLILKGISLDVAPGEVLVIGGPSGAGKTTLARQLAGLVPAQAGIVTLDGVNLATWRRDEVGRHIGYMPQSAPLLPGTIAENIGRYDDENDTDVIAAARQVGIHEAILRLPLAYDTPHSEAEQMLSANLVQRIAMARAIYRHPRLAIFDDPTSHLDMDGEHALAASVRALKAAGAAVVILSHRTNLFELADKLVILQDGAVKTAGPRSDVLTTLVRSHTTRQTPKLSTGR